MMKNKLTVESNIQWKIRNGSCSFWWDNWLGVGPLAHYTSNSNRFNNDSVLEFIEDGHWNMPKVLRVAPPSQVHNILSMQLQLQQGLPDQAVWKPNTSGLFSVSSAWNCIREKREKAKINTYNWHPKIPFKCSFLLWRAIRGKLPTNEKLSRFGIEPSYCHCCHSPGTDTIEHTFNSGDFAKAVWKYFAILLGIQTDFLPLRNMIMRWWSATYNNEAHNLSLHFLAYELDKFCNVIEKCSQDTKVTTVQWTKPPHRWVKLNTDGSALSNLGSIGAGGVVRNHLGEIILAFSAPLGTGTNNQEEVEAAIFGITWCIHMKYNKVILEVDSQLLVDWFKNNKSIPWNISSQMHQLHQLATQLDHFKCIHTFREANFVADVLSKHSHQIPTPQVYFNIQQLPKLAAAYFQQDLAEVLDKHKGNKNDNRPETTVITQQGLEEYNENPANVGQAATGIDSMLTFPNPIDNVVITDVVVAVGGLDRKEQETHTNLQEGVSKGGGGGELTHVRHEEVDIDHSRDSRAPTTPITNQQKTVTTQGNRFKVSLDDYGALNSEDEVDPDNQSMDETDEDAEATMQHTGQVFGSSFQEKSTDVQRKTEQQGLSPWGRKQTRHKSHQPIPSMYDNPSRPMTRSNSKDNSHIDKVRGQLQMDHAVSNPNGKIWLFWSNEVTGHILEKHAQRLTISFKHIDIPEQFMMSFIYAKCKDYMRRPLWDMLLFYANMDLPWCTLGDFNVITSIEEKLGGIPYNMNKSFEFIGMIEAYGLTDLGYIGLPFTWCNQKDAEARVWKRLDRSMVNDKWLEVMPQTTIENLSYVGSDHSSMLMEMTRVNESHIKYFKNLHFWVDNATFLTTVH
ncbi:hypothetical protein MTR67_007051 [Solanum verrucosum]|uniref:RNase H type-1 domain-containing protein n=1 Tax=Solanum verrucosum TaxID=315347 RepID=A0AAF0PZ75_SOLVR|nr:hypothetical protein MTR67_007051 [Solanum verrucosum]